MRIRMVSGSPGPGGGMVYALEIGRRLASRGHRVELWAPERRGGARPAAEGVELRAVPVPEPDGPQEEAARAVAAALGAAVGAAGRADVHHAQDTVSGLALLGLRDAGRVGAVVRTVHHVDVHAEPGMDEAQRATIQGADAVASVSRYWAGRLRQEYGCEAELVPTGVDAGRFAGCPLDRAQAGAEAGWGDRPVVLAVGGVARRKGSRALLEAFARARARLGAGALLAIVGESLDRDADYRAAFLRDADRLGFAVGGPRPGGEHAVALLGVVPEACMPVLYRGADVLACPSTREGFGLAALEAAAAGLPAVVSALPVFREHLEDGRDCLMAPVGDSGAMAAALVRAARDEALRARLRAGGRATVARQGWDAAAAAQERLYARLPVASRRR